MTTSPLDAAISNLYVAVQDAKMASMLTPKPGEGTKQQARARADAEVYVQLRRARALGATHERLKEEIGPDIWPYLD